MLMSLTILFALAYAVTVFLRKHSASLRHLVWVAAVAGSLLLPAMQWRMPKRVIQSQLPTVIQVVADSVATTQQTRTFDYLEGLWILGTGLLLIRTLARHLRLARVVSCAKQISKLGPIPVRMTAAIQGPGVCGVLRPSILVPEDSAAWPNSVKRAVFTHEVAHIRRRDTLTLLMAEIARAVYWFHPLTWFAFSELRKECERACDDAAIRLGLRPSSYAGHLLDLARAFPLEPAIPMATTSHLESRMKAILDPRMKRNTPARSASLAVAAATFATLIPLSSFSLQARQDNRPKTEAEEHEHKVKLAAERAEQQSGRPQSIRVSGNVAQNNLIVKVQPVYPPAAKERGSQGKVVLNVVISKEGMPLGIEAQPGDIDPDLVTASIDAVRQWRYRPTLLNGEPIEVATTVEVNFTLTQ